MWIKWAFGILTTMVYLTAGFYPFHWVFRTEANQNFHAAFQALLAGFGTGNVFDYLINLFGFIPYGLVIFYLTPGRSWVFATSICFGVSLTVEVGQLLFFPDRVPSFVDLVLNTLGGMFGAWVGKNYHSHRSHRFRVK